MTKRELARERMRQDAILAIEAAIAKSVMRFADNASRGEILSALMNERFAIVDGVLRGLRRNWRITERARGETTL